MPVQTTDELAPRGRVALGLLRETQPGERRVALVPSDVKRLSASFDILAEEGAGARAGFSDGDYEAAGSRTGPVERIRGSARVVVGIRAPFWATELAAGATLLSLGGRDASLTKLLTSAAISHLGLERLPRVTRAQGMDVLSSQASIIGYAAVLEGAQHLPMILPMLTTAAGVIRPANVMVLGAGVAGLQALATARRLGAVTHGFDVRTAAREQVESVGATFVAPDVVLASTETTGGYAREQSKDEQKSLRRALSDHLRKMNLIITTAQIPGQPAPLLIDDETLALLSPGTVIVDLAAESGGNTSRTLADQEVLVGDVTILGPTQLASRNAGDASRLFSGNIRQLLEHVGVKDGALQLNQSDPIVSALLGLLADGETGSP